MDRVRYIKRIDTGNPLRTYIDGQTIDVILPKNKVDIASLKLFYDVKIDPVYKYSNLPKVDAYIPSSPDLIVDDRTVAAGIPNANVFMMVYDPHHRPAVLPSLIPYQEVPGTDIPDLHPYIMTQGPLLPPQPEHRDPITGAAATDPDTRDWLYVPLLDDTTGEQMKDGEGNLLFEPLIDPETNEQAADDDGVLLFKIQRDDEGRPLTDPSTGTITYLPAEAPLVQILDENGNPMLNTQHILMMVDPAYVPPLPPLVQAKDKFGKPILYSKGLVMMYDPDFVPDVPPFPLPVARVGAPETFLKRFMPRLSSSIIDTLTIRRNGTVVQEIKDYNILYSILNDGLKAEDDLDGDKVDTLNYTKIGADNKPIKVCDFTNSTSIDAREPLTYRYFISNFLGLIGESSSSLIDAGKNEIMISIKLAPKYITYQGIDIHNIDHTDASKIADKKHEIDYTYKISNVFGNIDILPQATNVPDVISFKHYKTVKGLQTGTKDTQLVYKHKGKLDYILSTFVVGGNHDTGLQLQQCNKNAAMFGVPFKKNYGDLRDFVRTPITSQHVSAKMIKDLTTENNLDNSLYFARQALNVRASQYTLNGQAITPLMDMSQMYGQAKEFFNSQMTRVQSLSSFESEFFCFPVVISQDDETYVSEIEWRCYEGNNREYGLSYENKGKVYPLMYFVNYQKVYM